MRVGLIGCGGMGTTHNLALKALSTFIDVEVVALADCRKEKLEQAIQEWPDATGYVSGMELINNEDLDIVHICLPSHLHTKHAIVAMNKGINVFIEKPVCLTKEECKILLEAKNKTGVQVMVGQVVRCFEEYNFLRDAYRDKRFGELKSVVMQRVSGDPIWGFEDWFHDEAKSGTVVLDLHVHDLDFLRYMLGEPDSKEVKVTTFDNGLINQIITTYQFRDVIAMAEGTWEVSPALPFVASFRASFENALISFSSDKKPTLTVYHKDGTIEYPTLDKKYDVVDNTAGINVSNLGPYYTEIKYFLECLINSKENDIAPLEEGIKSVLLGLEELELAKKQLSKNK